MAEPWPKPKNYRPFAEDTEAQVKGITGDAETDKAFHMGTDASVAALKKKKLRKQGEGEGLRPADGSPSVEAP